MILTLPGEPIPKVRPRVTRHGTYDPQHLIKQSFRNHLNVLWEYEPLQKDLQISLQFYMKKPASWPKYKHKRPPAHTSRPDLDNLVKWIMDCGNEILWKDDAQITCITAGKWYGEPKTVIIIEPHEVCIAKGTH
jgi:Holliday junction resolvase RusA-like endonuclease